MAIRNENGRDQIHQQWATLQKNKMRDVIDKLVSKRNKSHWDVEMRLSTASTRLDSRWP